MAHTYTWDKLVKNATRLNPKTRGNNYPHTPKFELLAVIPYVGTNSCLIKLQAWGVTQNSLHQVTLLFHDCDVISDQRRKPSLWDYFKVEYKNKTYYVKKFNKLRNPLTSRCTCRDEFFTFAYQKYHIGHCLYGPAPRPYKRKTTWMPPRNGLNVVGCCKHVFNAWQFLSNKGFTVN